ncbi:MAG TPA: hypothetical protein VFU55_05195 [Terracidiphilus sp.]|nr:hypothetical protein [Terracidiphilus sp.]
MKPEYARLEQWYARALGLYPMRFREAYDETMAQAFHDALEDPGWKRGPLLRTTARDLAVSLGKEWLAMMFSSLTRPALMFNALVLAGISTVLALFLYAIPQQVLRQSLNDPQIQMAGDLAAKLETGTAATEAVAAKKVDMARSLDAFANVYDGTGRVLTGQGELDGHVIGPPQGVFDYVRQHGQERVTWQPRPGVRIAAVVERVTGAQTGFVLAGRNMREVEARETHVGQLAGMAWLAMLGLIASGTLGFAWYTERRAR